jgi:arabinofuranan 3-O-arabinosyltransferase
VLVWLALGRRRRDDELAPTPAVTRAGWWVSAVVVVGGLAVAGPVGVIVAALAAWVWPERWLSRAAAGAFALATILVLFDPGRLPGSGHGSFGRPVQLLATCAVVAVAASLVERPRRAHA